MYSEKRIWRADSQNVGSHAKGSRLLCGGGGEREGKKNGLKWMTAGSCRRNPLDLPRYHLNSFFFPSPKHFNFWFLPFLVSNTYVFWPSIRTLLYVCVGVVYSVRKGGGEKMGERKKPPVRQPSRVRDRIGGRRTTLWTGRVIKSIPTEKRKKEKVYLSAKMSPHRPQSIISVERVCLCHCSLLAMWWC